MRGTPQQIIDKYNQLARDAQLANDRVAAENFQQHAEHYLRMLGEAQREQDQRREEVERQNRDRQVERDRDRAERQERESNGAPAEPAVEFAPEPMSPRQPDLLALEPIDIGEGDDTGLVETPENQPKKAPSSPRKPRSSSASSRAKSSSKPKEEGGAEEAGEKPAPKTSSRSSSRKPASKKTGAEAPAEAAPALGGDNSPEAAE